MNKNFFYHALLVLFSVTFILALQAAESQYLAKKNVRLLEKEQVRPIVINEIFIEQMKRSALSQENNENKKTSFLKRGFSSQAAVALRSSDIKVKDQVGNSGTVASGLRPELSVKSIYRGSYWKFGLQLNMSYEDYVEDRGRDIKTNDKTRFQNHLLAGLSGERAELTFKLGLEDIPNFVSPQVGQLEITHFSQPMAAVDYFYSLPLWTSCWWITLGLEWSYYFSETSDYHNFEEGTRSALHLALTQKNNHKKNYFLSTSFFQRDDKPKDYSQSEKGFKLSFGIEF